MPEIALQFDIAAPRDAVLAALNTHDGLTGWFTDAVDREGDVLLFDLPGAPEPFRLRLERTDRDRVVWANAGAFPPHWAGTWITWDLTDQPQAPERTRLVFRHGGWQPGSEGSVPMVAGNWAELLVRLKDYAQSGKVQPYFVTTRRHAEE